VARMSTAGSRSIVARMSTAGSRSIVARLSTAGSRSIVARMSTAGSQNTPAVAVRSTVHPAAGEGKRLRPIEQALQVGKSVLKGHGTDTVYRLFAIAPEQYQALCLGVVGGKGSEPA